MSIAAAIVAATTRSHTAPRMQGRDRHAPDSDEAMMHAWQSGDMAAFDRLYERHRGGVFRYFLRQCGVHAVAEELHHDVWLKAIAARDRWRPEARVSTWLFTIARHRLIDHWRVNAPRPRRTRRNTLPRRLDPQANAAVRSKRGSPPHSAHCRRCKDAFLLHVEGPCLGEIARLTGTLPETVKPPAPCYAPARIAGRLGEHAGSTPDLTGAGASCRRSSRLPPTIPFARRRAFGTPVVAALCAACGGCFSRRDRIPGRASEPVARADRRASCALSRLRSRLQSRHRSLPPLPGGRACDDARGGALCATCAQT